MSLRRPCLFETEIYFLCLVPVCIYGSCCCLRVFGKIIFQNVCDFTRCWTGEVSCWLVDSDVASVVSFWLTFVFCAVHLDHHVVQLLLLRHADALQTHTDPETLLHPFSCFIVKFLATLLFVLPAFVFLFPTTFLCHLFAISQLVPVCICSFVFPPFSCYVKFVVRFLSLCSGFFSCFVLVWFLSFSSLDLFACLGLLSLFRPLTASPSCKPFVWFSLISYWTSFSRPLASAIEFL